MKLTGLPQQLVTQPAMAVELVQTWFNPDDIIVISGKRSIRQSKNINVFSQCLTASDFVSQMGTQDGAEILQSLCTEPEPMDVYINVGTPISPLSDYRKRVREDDLSRVIGIIGDFDVKDGSFKSTEQILDFLRGLEIWPTMIVESGSGGVHAWWKFTEDNVTVSLGKEIAVRWWSHLHSRATSQYNAQVDKLYDTARMLRLPGTLHWPREGIGDTGQVTLRYAKGSPTPVGRFMEVSEGAWRERLVTVHRTRESDRSMRLATDEYQKMLGSGGWAELYAMSNVEEYFNENVPWSNVLVPAGWTFTRQDSAGRSEWARPGRDGEKSACVDWPESPEMMSLLSTSHDTGLLDLLDAEIPLTKWRVSLRLNFKDNYQEMVKWTLNLMRSRG